MSRGAAARGLTGFVLRRVAATAVLLLAVSLLIFVGCEILPGDVAQIALGQYATEDSVRALREQMGLDQPAAWRYLHWLGGILQLDFGRSLLTKLPVTQMLSERVANTALLAGAATLISLPLAIGLGLWMAMRAGSRTDRAATIAVIGLSATPEFLVATLAVLFFAVGLGWLPAVAYLSPGSGWGRTAQALILPTATLVIVVTAQIARMTRSIVTGILEQPYIEMALLKGVPRRRIVLRHALVNAVGPIANVAALNVAYLVSGIVVVESIFAYPGLAGLMIDAVQSRDMPVVQACAMIFCATYVLMILLADVLARLSDPRSRAESGRVAA